MLTNSDRLPIPGAENDGLLCRLNAGDQRAIEVLYDRHRRLLFSVAFRILRDRESAEEVLQDIFLQLWRKPFQFDPNRGPLIAWLVSIARNRAISRLRRIPVASQDCLCAETIQSPVMLQSTALENRQAVSVALKLLSPGQLDAITLAYFDGLTCVEIAVRTGESLGTIKSRLRTALKKMRISTKASTKYFRKPWNVKG